MKYLSIVVLTLILQGCGDLTGGEITLALDYCEDKGGIESIWGYGRGRTVRCVYGEQTILNQYRK